MYFWLFNRSKTIRTTANLLRTKWPCSFVRWLTLFALSFSMLTKMLIDRCRASAILRKSRLTMTDKCFSFYNENQDWWTSRGYERGRERERQTFSLQFKHICLKVKTIRYCYWSSVDSVQVKEKDNSILFVYFALINSLHVRNREWWWMFKHANRLTRSLWNSLTEF